MQQILEGIDHLEAALHDAGCHNYMLVCDSAFAHLPIGHRLHAKVVFDQFTPNPLYEDVCHGVELFNANGCDAIVAVGGGSTIDVGKCIKLFCRMDPTRNYLQQEATDSGVPLLAVPTTAGTGSESTRYAVIYFEGKKQSITHPSIVPNWAILEPELLRSLPLYQKKCTMLDALCQAMESAWSLNSTPESLALSREAIAQIMQHHTAYVEQGSAEAAAAIMRAANKAGQAINITQTTAPHAMSYKLTSLYGIPHGHAVAMCLPWVWQHMLQHMSDCADPRGEAHLADIFVQLATLLHCHTAAEGPDAFRQLMRQLGMPHDTRSNNRDAELQVLTTSVNPIRLKNSPIPLSETAIRNIYENIVL